MRACVCAQGGFTLVEQLVVLVILTIVVGATLTALNSLMKAAPADQEWSHIVADAQSGMYRMTRELRQGFNVTLVTGYVASADVVVNGSTKHVLFQCDLSSTCTRKFTTAPAAAPARGAGGATLIKYAQNFAQSTPVFTATATKYYEVKLVVRSGGAQSKSTHTHNVTLVDGFLTRNS
jgi:prepilin-type N-terminal cleavage/methylation domain-containing protein